MTGSLEGVEWEEAWALARDTLEGVTRLRAPGSQPGVELALLDWGGEGDLIVFHHANGFCAATLAPIAHALRDRFRVVSVDARGHGDSAPIPPGEDGAAYDWDVLAADLVCAVRTVLEQTGHRSAALGVGHSFGGALMLRAAAREPALFERLLLCDPVILPRTTADEQAKHAKGSEVARKARRRRDHFPTRREAFEHCRSRGLFARFTPEALALYVGEGMRDTPDGQVALKCAPAVEAAIFDGGAQSGQLGDLSQITAEVLFIHALRGNFQRDLYDQVADRIPRARVESLELGHLFPLEEPARALSAIYEVLGIRDP